MQFWLRDLGYAISVRLDRATSLRFDIFMDLNVGHEFNVWDSLQTIHLRLITNE